MNQGLARSNKSGHQSCYHLNLSGYADARRLIHGISGANADEDYKSVAIECYVVSSQVSSCAINMEGNASLMARSDPS